MSFLSICLSLCRYPSLSLPLSNYPCINASNRCSLTIRVPFSACIYPFVYLFGPTISRHPSAHIILYPYPSISILSILSSSASINPHPSLHPARGERARTSSQTMERQRCSTMQHFVMWSGSGPCKTNLLVEE